jgi:hypothetical protein
MYPEDFDTSDWREKHRRPHPRYWRYVCYSACHWLVNFALRLAMLAERSRRWRIVSTSNGHSTVWDGADTLFDLPYQALGVGADVCWEKATNGVGKLEPEPGDYIRTVKPS